MPTQYWLHCKIEENMCYNTCAAYYAYKDPTVLEVNQETALGKWVVVYNNN